jgi:glycosyltransferase involved in cell wall biosynthesis
MQYVIISPVRNEEKYIGKTLQSVVSQTVAPAEWVIVDDGSTDKTVAIVKRYATQHRWIRLVMKSDRGFAQVGKGVMETFDVGFRSLSCGDWEYIAKLDCDLSLQERYFESIINALRGDDDLGIAGGPSYVLEKGKIYEEKMPDFHPAACSRVYKRKCFEEIGGLPVVLGWDTIDLLRAHMKGWKTRNVKEQIVTHHRRMSSRKGSWEGKTRQGRNFYITGYHPLFLVARSVYRVKERPYFVETFGVIYGYLRALWQRERIVISPEEMAFLRRQQMMRLLGHKI